MECANVNVVPNLVDTTKSGPDRQHGGTTIHHCVLNKDHAVWCKCFCGYRWLGEKGQECR